MNQNILRNRTKRLALQVVQVSNSLKGSPANLVFQRQIIRSATSVGANYRAACRAKSKPDFIHKLKIVEEELDETMYWIELIQAENQDLGHHFLPLHNEANELLSIIVATIRSLRGPHRKS